MKRFAKNITSRNRKRTVPWLLNYLPILHRSRRLFPWWFITRRVAKDKRSSQVLAGLFTGNYRSKTNFTLAGTVFWPFNRINISLLKMAIMKPDNTRGTHTSQQENKKPHTNQQKKVVPQTGTDTSATNAGGSMSEGNLSNSRYSRERTRSLHDKHAITGSDNDGQTN